MNQDIQIVSHRNDTDLAPIPDAMDDGSGKHPTSLLKTLQTLLQGRWKWAITLALIGAFLGGAGGFFLAKEPEYQSVGMLQIKPFVPGILNESTPLPMFDAYLDSQVAIMQSRRTIDMAMQNPEWKIFGRGLSDSSVADFQSHLSIVRQGGIIVDVIFLDTNPAAARAAVKSVIQAYQTIYDDANTGDENRRSQILDDLKTSYMTQLKRLRDSMQEEFGPASVASTYQYQLEELNRIESELQRTQLDLRMAEAAINGQSAGTQPSTMPAPDEPVTPKMIAAIEPEMRQHLTDLSNIENNLDGMLQRYGENHPSVQELRAEQRVLKDVIARRVKDYEDNRKIGGTGQGKSGDRIIPGYSALTLTQLRVREEGLRDLDNHYKTSLKELGAKNMQIEALRDETANVQEQLDKTKARIQQLSIENQIGGRISVISDGDAPFRPFIDKRRQLTVMGTLGGMSFGFGIILLIAFLDQRVKNVADAQSRIRGNNRMLGVLPRLPDDLSDPQQASIAAYCVHHIRTILQIEAGPNHQVIAVSSPSPGDGKTSLAVALGLSFAASNSKTLLIDCDVIGGGLTARMNAIIRRKIGDILVRLAYASQDQIDDALKAAQFGSRRLGEILIERKVVTEEQLAQALTQQQESLLGLLDVVDGEPLANCIGATGTPDLDILPLGHAGATHAAQISPRLLRGILNQAREMYDVVLIDTGPILGSLEACVAAAEADGVVLTVSRGGLRSLAHSAIAQLDSVGARVLGIVFNRALADDITSSGFSSPVSAASVRANSQGEYPTRGGLVKLGPVARAVAANTASSSNGTH